MRILVLFALVVYSPLTLCFEALDKGSESYTSMGLSDKEFVRFTKIARKISDMGYKGGDLRHFIKNNSDVYSLMKDMSIVGYSNEDDKLIGKWPLTTYPVTLLHSEHQQVVLSRGGTEEFEDRSPSTAFTAEEASLYETDSLGCLDQTPLRYGDLNGDEQPELFVIQEDRLSISSPALKKEIFAAVWNHRDEAETRLQEEIKQEGGYLNPLYENKGAQAPHYVAGSGMEYKVQRIFPAVRAYAKLYFGDFDKNGASDIIMWRKVYESNTVADEAEGFHLKAENWFHYEQTEGVYELKQTESSAVLDWFADNELTWQKGYPRKSECEGEEGELIPKMHDPLLNDPELFQ